MLYPKQNQYRDLSLLDGVWQFRLDPDDVGLRPQGDILAASINILARLYGWGGWLENGATGAPAQSREVLVLVDISAHVSEPVKISRQVSERFK